MYRPSSSLILDSPHSQRRLTETNAELHQVISSLEQQNEETAKGLERCHQEIHQLKSEKVGFL
jgi:hypothetical protein